MEQKFQRDGVILLENPPVVDHNALTRAAEIAKIVCERLMIHGKICHNE
jgi:hypothetical protein